MLTLFSTMFLSLDDLYKLAIVHKVFGATNSYSTTTATSREDWHVLEVEEKRV